jgi:hypothetical protein
LGKLLQEWVRAQQVADHLGIGHELRDYLLHWPILEHRPETGRNVAAGKPREPREAREAGWSWLRRCGRGWSTKRLGRGQLRRDAGAAGVCCGFATTR